ncbi:DUF2254 domain-containing protein [Blastococcus sp. CCUG 61487]|uniref:DUF2254 domain-containing protein n=1 Tax=Blastococcus sp. CCUG 61487 TaxID=1840703 RepID=UPI0010C06E59|nr:DUF2254 domain-containing protein [Blastococcus sp. CCUG 61487]TKJ16809.1 hypothetical protein A6V29_13030 [Blastococcus sp. CCUG 61487]
MSRPRTGLHVAAIGYRFRESLLLLPALIVVGGVLLAEVTRLADRWTGEGGDPPFTLHMSNNTATWLLSTVAGAMITTAGVVFSLTVVSLQLASSQFSPRVMRSFIRDRLAQVVIGALVATFVYCVLTLRVVSGSESHTAAPIPVTVAVVLTVVTVLLIVAYLDHLAHGMQVGEVVRRITGEAEHVLAAVVRRTAAERPVPGPAPFPDEAALAVPATTDGWVTQAPTDRLLAAVPPRSTLRLETRVGAYIHQGEPLAHVWPPPDRPDRVLADVQASVLVGHVRTMQDDVDFALRQLVDIGLRALSPAINDPTTAVEVVLRIGSLLRRVLVAELPQPVVEGAEGRRLVRPWELSAEEYVVHGFEQLRQTAGSQPQVVAALARVLRMLVLHLEEAGRTEALPELRRQLRLLLDMVEGDPDLHVEDVAHLREVAEAQVDPADHTGRGGAGPSA